MSGAVRRALLLATVIVAAIVLTATTLAAHGALRRSTPAAGTRLAAPLERLVLEFTEAVETRFVRVTLRDAEGREVTRPPLTFSTDRQTVTVVDPQLAGLRGAVDVRWSIAGADGHPVEGSFRFVVDAPPLVSPELPAAGPLVLPADSARGIPTVDHTATDRLARPWMVAVRWITYIALYGLIGSACVLLVLLPMARRRSAFPLTERLDQMTRSAYRGLGSVVLVLLGVRLIAQAVLLDATDAGSLTALLTTTGWGRGWLAAACGTAVLRWQSLQTRAGAFAALAALVIGAVGWSAMGHAGAVGASALVTDAAHLLAGGVWAGSLGWLVAIALPTTRQDPAARAAILAAFAPVALSAGAVLAVSGATNAWRFVGSVDALFSTDYGRTLLLKLGVLGAMGAVGFANWRVFGPRASSPEGLRRLAVSATLELTLALVILLIVARLVVTAAPGLGTP